MSLEDQFFFLTTKSCLILSKTTCGELESKSGVTVEFMLHSLPNVLCECEKTQVHTKKFEFYCVPKFKFSEPRSGITKSVFTPVLFG